MQLMEIEGKMDNLDEKGLMTCADVSKYLGLKPSRIRYETFLKRIPHIKIGRSVRYTKIQLDAWIKGLTRNVADLTNE